MKTRLGKLIAMILALVGSGSAFQSATTNGEQLAVIQERLAAVASLVTGDLSEGVFPGFAPYPHASQLAEPDDQDDPAYSLYKSGYKLILEEQWAAARAKFSELLSKYSASKYCADAQYWAAYSLKYSDKKKAIAAYNSFLKAYPSSRYYDDAVGDLARLEEETQQMVPPPDRFAPPTRNVGVPVPRYKVPYTVAAAAEAAKAYDLAATERVTSAKTYDPQMRMRVEAFQSLVRSGKDQKTLDMVKQTLLDPQQPNEMRETALYALKSFDDKARSAFTMSRDSTQSPAMREAAGKVTKAYDDFDLQGFYLQVLKSDTSAWLAQNIIFQLGQYAERGDERVVAELKRIALDGRRPRNAREAALYSLRNTKRPDLIEFYGQIAKQDEDPRIRLSAIYQIGMASKENETAAFNLLKEYATDKSQGREMREAALFSLRSLHGKKAADVYLESAKSDADEQIQQLSLHYFVEASKDQPEKVFTMLKDILQDRSRSLSIRATALYQLARIGSDEAFNVVVSIAQTEPEERLQTSAVEFISHLSKNKAKSLKTLISLFQTLKKEQTAMARSLLYAIGTIGNDEAVEYIGKVAKTHEDYDIRRTAIQFLGSIGGEKARAILVEIMNSR